MRIKDVDLDRLQVIVRSGKGDKDRVTLLPEKLVERLRAHRDRLRPLFDQDRGAALPGVWIPEALERKYPGAGPDWGCEARWMRCRRRKRGKAGRYIRFKLGVLSNVHFPRIHTPCRWRSRKSALPALGQHAHMVSSFIAQSSPLR